MIILPAYTTSFSSIKNRNNISKVSVGDSDVKDTNKKCSIATTTLLPAQYEMDQIMSPNSLSLHSYLSTKIPFRSPVVTNINNKDNSMDSFRYPSINEIRSVDNNLNNVMYNEKMTNDGSTSVSSNASRIVITTPYYGKRVLLVDDSSMTRKMFYRFIIERCESVDEADDGDVAVEMVKKSLENNIMYDVK